MSEELQSILLEDFEITWPGFTLHRVALNQHMPRVEKLSEHVHSFHQVLVYLRGYGTQHVEDETIAVERGSVLVIAPGRRHRFVKARHLRPVCLAIDFDAGTEAENWQSESRMTPRHLSQIEKWLVALHEEQSAKRGGTIQSASLILQVLSLIERTVDRGETEAPGPVESAVESLIESHGFVELTPAILADRFSCSLDHLNRTLKAENGMTVGEKLRRVRLEKAVHLLRTTNHSIGDVGSAVGMDDQNYFARWFRQHTGQTPTRWREAMQGA